MCLGSARACVLDVLKHVRGDLANLPERQRTLTFLLRQVLRKKFSMQLSRKTRTEISDYYQQPVRDLGGKRVDPCCSVL